MGWFDARVTDEVREHGERNGCDEMTSANALGLNLDEIYTDEPATHSDDEYDY